MKPELKKLLALVLIGLISTSCGTLSSTSEHKSPSLAERINSRMDRR